MGYHPLVQNDVNGVPRHYDTISPRLGDEFWAELMDVVESVSSDSGRFHFSDRG